MMFAIVYKDSIKAVAVIDKENAEWAKINFPSFEVVEISCVYSNKIIVNNMLISVLILYTINTEKTKYYIIEDKPSCISLEDAYKLLK